MKERELKQTKKMISDYLRRAAVIAKVGIEAGEWSKEEAEIFVGEYGNEQFSKILNMGEDEFAVFAMGEALHALGEHVMGGTK